MNNRPIKFRAWDGEQMSKGFDIHRLDAEGGDPVIGSCFWEGAAVGEYEYLANCKIMQYTGLTDSEGNPVYEGDLLKVTLHNDWKGDSIAYNWHFIKDEPLEVFYQEGLWKLRPSNPDKYDYPILFDSWALEFEVIGNVFEDKELLSE